MAGIYQNNVTRPGLEYRSRDAMEFLSLNYVEVVNLIHYHCKHQGEGKEWEEDFRSWFLMKYLLGVNNYYPQKGDVSPFLYMAIYFAMSNYRQQELHYQDYETFLGDEGKLVDVYEGGGDVDREMFTKVLKRIGVGSYKIFEGRNVYLEVFELRCCGYSGREIGRKLGVSEMYISKVSDVIKRLYLAVSQGIVRDPAKFVRTHAKD
jgi:hypothetical protein